MPPYVGVPLRHNELRFMMYDLTTLVMKLPSIVGYATYNNEYRCI